MTDPLEIEYIEVTELVTLRWIIVALVSGIMLGAVIIVAWGVMGGDDG